MAAVRSIFACRGRTPVRIQLPFTQLQQLQSLTWEECVLAEQQDGASSSSSSGSSSAASDSGSGPLSSLTSLTALKLKAVKLDWRAGIHGISALTRLRQLMLSYVQDEDGYAIVDCFSPLPQLPQLTALSLTF
jgi:hypothetical protein